MRARVSGEELYEALARLGTGVAVAREYGLNDSWVNRKIRAHRRSIGLVGRRVARPWDDGTRRSPARDLGGSPTRESVGEAPEVNPEPSGAPRRRPPAAPRAADVDRTFRALGRIEHKLDVLLSRPPSLVEWRPDHRRLADGGVQVTEQRKSVALPKRHGRPR